MRLSHGRLTRPDGSSASKLSIVCRRVCHLGSRRRFPLPAPNPASFPQVNRLIAVGSSQRDLPFILVSEVLVCERCDLRCDALFAEKLRPKRLHRTASCYPQQRAEGVALLDHGRKERGHHTRSGSGFWGNGGCAGQRSLPSLPAAIQASKTLVWLKTGCSFKRCDKPLRRKKRQSHLASTETD